MQAYDIDIDDGETRRRMRTALSARAERLAARGERLLDEGWDINTLILLADDAGWLAGVGQHLATAELAAPLAAIDALLQPFLDPPRLPDAAARAGLAALVATVEAACAGARADDPVTLASQALVERTRAEENGFPLLASPPPDYWRRHAIEPQEAPLPVAAAAPMPDLPDARTAAARTGTDPAAVPPASAEDALPTGAEPALCYYLGPAGDLALAIEQHLALRGIGFSRFDRADGFKGQLTRQPPGLVVVDAGFETALDEIGALVKSARERVMHRVHLAAFSAGGDLNARLHAMRAGCDAFIALPASTPAVLARLDELAHAHTPDPYRILIIEDDRTQALFADSILRKGGMQTLTLTDALAVLDELDRFRPDLILMDLHMPGCDGMELTALIREREAFVSTPIVFLSGEQDADKHFDALSAGGDDFLSKPIRPKHLISAVLNRVRRARRQQRRTPVPAEARALSGPVEKRQLLDRLSGLLAMDDAGRREGGLLFFGVEYTAAPHERIGWSRRDRLIEALGRHLGEAIGPGDLVTRCGDSGFAVLTRERGVAALEDWAGAQRTRLLAALEEPALGLAVGICPFNAGIGDAGAMLDAAEHAAAGTGLTGVASVQVASPVDPALGPRLRAALAADGLDLVFQPIVSLHGEEQAQFQVLLRLAGDDGRLHTAAEIIPAAEREGLMTAVDQCVLDRCLAIAADRYRQEQPLRLFVSQSLASTCDPAHLAWLEARLAGDAHPRGWLSIDLRLADFDAEPAAARAFAVAARDLGVLVTISGCDGPAAAHAIAAGPAVDFVKLGPGPAGGRTDAQWSELKETVALVHAGGARVIAPRIEDARGAAALWGAGVDYIQGNFVQQATGDLGYDFHASAP
ncbi:EAL domain-containing response regulator [Dokdonella koreensis]|uniref:Two-component response regulator n=1 Tax=Dokdonella koreensis DS-123 TaxID=1300342 RepID=A0A160DXA0_9GAMM|nr:EAL domain-containing protein [Dokdonella koreensis]ANB19319.1 Two-component response regulator [Dokdonella koreensis DS-123]